MNSVINPPFDADEIPPAITIPVLRWETSPRAPHRSAPELLMEDPGLPNLALDQLACRRLPCDSVDIDRH
ncbi:MAG: hypothetical protein KDB03_03055 [Planctomycetales bacterium]|nr:hypothetical protein [Planctomycetales bacterium]